MSKYLLIAKMMLRTRIYFVIIALTILFVLLGIIGSIIVSANTINYASIKLGEQVSNHIIISFEVNPTTYKIYNEFNQNITRFFKKLYGHENVENISAIELFSSSIPGIAIYLNITSMNKTIRLFPGYGCIATMYYNSSYIRLENDSIEEGVYVYRSFLHDINQSLDMVIGSNVSIIVNDTTYNRALYVANTRLAGVFSVITRNESILQFTPATMYTSRLQEIAAILPREIFENITKIYIDRYGGAKGQYLVSIQYIVSIRLKSTSIPFYNPDIAIRYIDDFIDNVVDKEAIETLGYSIKPRVQSFLFVTAYSSAKIHVAKDYGEIEGSVDLRSPLRDVIVTTRGIGQLQMAQQVVFRIVIPLFIGSWFLLSTTSRLLIDYLRRGIALLYTRGVSKDLIRNSYLVLLVIIIIALSLASVPVGVYIGNYIASLIYGRLYAEASVSDITLYIIAIILAVVTIILLTRSLLKFFKKTSFDLTLVTRVYVPVIREPWKPSTLLIVFTILSCIKYAMWLAGVTVADLIMYVSQSGNPGLMIAVIIYGIIDSILNIIAPYVITYFLVMYITHNEKILGFLSKTISRIVAGKYHNEVSEIISKGSTRLYSASFIIALVLAITLYYIGLSSSFSEWYPSAKSFYQELLGYFALVTEYVMEGTMYAYRSIVVYGVALAVLTATLVATVMTKDLEKELVVLRARGGGRKDIVRILYGVVFTLVILGLIVGCIAGIIWLRGSLVSVHSSLRGALQSTGLTTNKTIPELNIVFKPVDIGYICLIIASLLILPLVSIFLWFRKPVVEKLRGVMS